ncbi:hypothetical protein SISSUDRAFT_1048645 [Sistotremastrum suecicum HHB10207 ss-3]|uniref:Uncharacterized protein n=1 Tax=Sistotremastrum suecicum HHB10207 ss-3 TaxID=1314776 RepID=A0A166CD38_9AGAM|nr:hypothetical protein SISSUDRAFT_1048645 [Sistotremastrum suecicum HHB10207 ss-3]
MKTVGSTLVAHRTPTAKSHPFIPPLYSTPLHPPSFPPQSINPPPATFHNQISTSPPPRLEHVN